MIVPLSHGPVVGDSHITFYLPDPDSKLDAVRLYQEVTRPNLGPELARKRGGPLWEGALLRPPVDRMEYEFVISTDGQRDMVLDPGNPTRAGGPLGEKSVLEFPGYRPPAWLGAPRPPLGNRRRVQIRSRALGMTLQLLLWSSHGTKANERVPLLVVNDGIDYAVYSQLVLMLEVMTAEDRLPPMRAALIQPVNRDETYSASASHARAVADEILPALQRVAPTPPGRNARVGMGSSLGALAMLHTHRRNPRSFGALFLQSGSYFRRGLDDHESTFARFPWIAAFVQQLHSSRQWAYPLPVTMTCGAVEENLPNNRLIYESLTEQGYEVRFVENRDGHNWVSWRDTFDPNLVDLLRTMWM